MPGPDVDKRRFDEEPTTDRELTLYRIDVLSDCFSSIAMHFIKQYPAIPESKRGHRISREDINPTNAFFNGALIMLSTRFVDIRNTARRYGLEGAHPSEEQLTALKTDLITAY